MSKPDPLDQLTRFRIDVDDARRDRDLAAVQAELRRRPAPVPRGRRWTLGAVVAVMLAGPAAAVASDNAAPGDLLYPVKLAAEPIVRLFDGDVVAERRVDEVAVLIDRKSEDSLIEERIAVARDAVAETDAPQYGERLDQIVDRWVDDRARPPVTDVAPPAPQDPPDEPSNREAEPPPVDTPSTTTMSTDDARDTPPPPDSTTTTTTTTTVEPPPSDREPPPPDDRPRDRP